MKMRGALLLVLLLPTFAYAESLKEAMQKLRAVADGYPAKVNSEDRPEIERLWKWVEAGAVKYQAGRPGPDEDAEMLLAEIYRLGFNLDLAESDKAITHYKAAIAINPANATAHLGLGRHLTFMNAAEQGEPELLLAVALDPHGMSDQALFFLAYNFYFQKRYALAASFAQRYLKVAPDDKAMQVILETSKRVLAGGAEPKVIDVTTPH